MLPQISYVPTDWKDEVPGEDPVTYDIQGLTAGKTIVPHVAPAAGTPVNATNLNNIETGLAAAIAGAHTQTSLILAVFRLDSKTCA